MDLKEYISSGILESYVIGNTSPEEVQEVQRMMELHPEIKQEVEAIESALIEHASLQAKIPPAKLKERIIDEIEERNARVISMDAIVSRKSSFYKYATAAAVLLFIISMAANFSLFKHLRAVQRQVATLNNEKSKLASDFQVEKANYENQLGMLNSPSSKPVMLKGMPLSPSSMAMVYWNPKTHEVYINVKELPAPPPGKQYQLWALADGQPVDAGVFNSDEDSGMQKMKSISAAQAFAVTLEKEGGSPAPTLNEMYVMGNI